MSYNLYNALRAIREERREPYFDFPEADLGVPTWTPEAYDWPLVVGEEYLITGRSVTDLDGNYIMAAPYAPMPLSNLDAWVDANWPTDPHAWD